jgi:hypothetical protein
MRKSKLKTHLDGINQLNKDNELLRKKQQMLMKERETVLTNSRS